MSSGNRIPKVWTAEHPGISKPTPASTRSSRASPNSLLAAVSATGTSNPQTSRTARRLNRSRLIFAKESGPTPEWRGPPENLAPFQRLFDRLLVGGANRLGP